jgi:hypothetical protein
LFLTVKENTDQTILDTKVIENYKLNYFRPSSQLNVPGKYLIDLAGLFEPHAYDIHARERTNLPNMWVLQGYVPDAPCDLPHRIAMMCMLKNIVDRPRAL